MGEPLLRPATASDALALSVVAAQVFIDTYAPGGITPKFAREVTQTFDVRDLAALLARGESRFVVAEQEGALQGFVQWKAGGQPLLPEGPSAEVQRLYVLRSASGQGIGAQLLARAEHDAAALGARQVWLMAWVGNDRALGFYARQGYRVVGTAQYTFEDDSWENKVFAKVLDAGSNPVPQPSGRADLRHQ